MIFPCAFPFTYENYALRESEKYCIFSCESVIKYKFIINYIIIIIKK